MTDLKRIETEVLAHRYCYYVLADPVIPDGAYDLLERDARAALPDTSPVHGVGSSLPSSYGPEVVALTAKWGKA